MLYSSYHNIFYNISTIDICYIFEYNRNMANKTAPYNNPQTMNKIDQWWSASFPTNRTGVMHIIELYKSFEEYTKMDVYSPDWIDANQFAKCLVASRITDIGGWWARLDTWEPKEYEIKRAKVY